MKKESLGKCRCRVSHITQVSSIG